MKPSMSCVLMFSLTTICLSSVSAYWWPVVGGLVCRVTCAKECRHQVCKGICSACNIIRGRRSVDRQGTGMELDPGFNMVPLPRDFLSYDYDPRDGFIDYKPEFVIAMGLDSSDPGTMELFQRADKDKDGRLSRSEFSKAPWVFEIEDDVGDANAVYDTDNVNDADAYRKDESE